MSLLSLKDSVFQLPSLGMAYDQEKFPLISGDSVKIKPLTVGDQRYIAKFAGDAYQAYFGLIMKVVTEPKIDIDALLLDDVNAILYAMRILTYGADYKVPFVCDMCEQLCEKDILLTDLEVKSADEVDEFKADGIEVELAGKKIEIHQLRLRDEKAINRHLTSLRKSKHIDGADSNVDKIYVRHAQVIDKIDGEEVTIQDKMDFIDNLNPTDFKKFTELKDDLSIGLLTDLEVECTNPRCGFVNDTRLAITPQFFRS